MPGARFVRPLVKPRMAMSEPVLRIGGWLELRKAASAVRRAVFIEEQSIPESLEWDDADPDSLHAVIFEEGRAVATGRLLPDGRIGRMAVLSAWRSRGLGGRVLEALVEMAFDRGDRRVFLDAQCHAEGFYRQHRFVSEGEPFDDAGIAHRRMSRLPD